MRQTFQSDFSVFYYRKLFKNFSGQTSFCCPFVKIIHKTRPLKLAYLEARRFSAENIAEIRRFVQCSDNEPFSWYCVVNQTSLRCNLPLIGDQYMANWWPKCGILPCNMPLITPSFAVSDPLGHYLWHPQRPSLTIFSDISAIRPIVLTPSRSSGRRKNLKVFCQDIS